MKISQEVMIGAPGLTATNAFGEIMRKTFFGLLAVLTLTVLALPVTGFSADLSTSQVQSLRDINTKIMVVRELAGRNLMTTQQAADSETVFVQEAKQVVGYEVTLQQIQTLVSNAEKTEGLGVFWNILIVAAGALFLIAFLGLIVYYLEDLLAQVPPIVYEFLAYLAMLFTALSGYLFNPFHIGIVRVEPLWFAVPGALALAGCLYLTYQLHFGSDTPRHKRVYMGPGLIDFPTVMFGLCTAGWAAMAIFYNQIFPAAGIPHVLAFASVIALQACLGFSVITWPGCVAMGWKNDAQVPRSVLASLIILAGYVAKKLLGGLETQAWLFEPGAIFMGAFVYYLGLLVMSNKWYCSSGSSHDSRNRARWIGMQVVTITSGILALYFGSVYHMGALLGVGGTFFALYLLEKYYEIPWKGVGWLWSLLGAAVLLYFIVGFANNHSEYFVWGIR